MVCVHGWVYIRMHVFTCISACAHLSFYRLDENKGHGMEKGEGEEGQCFYSEYARVQIPVRVEQLQQKLLSSPRFGVFKACLPKSPSSSFVCSFTHGHTHTHTPVHIHNIRTHVRIHIRKPASWWLVKKALSHEHLAMPFQHVHSNTHNHNWSCYPYGVAWTVYSQSSVYADKHIYMDIYIYIDISISLYT